MTTVERVAARIIARSDAEHPADAVLRAELKAERLPRAESRVVAEAVFSWFRWRGWLEAGGDIPAQLPRARELDMRFASDPTTFSTAELMRAVPAWIAEELAITREWLVSLQTWPVLWLRAKRGMGGPLSSALGYCERGAGPPIPAAKARQASSPGRARGKFPAGEETRQTTAAETDGSASAAETDCSTRTLSLADALEYQGEEDLFRTAEFHAGEFEVQDIASQMVGLLCNPRPGETWWDACAGEGGKLLHLSDLMQNHGLIWASDRSERRRAKLKQRAARAKAFNYRLAAWDGSAKLPTKTKFDGVLIDAPCSGVGTWQRNPHARWTTTPKDVRELAALQQQLVLNAAAGVKPGGRLIYAVCTLTRSETDAVADFCSPQLPGFAPSPLPAWPNEPPETSDRKWIWPQICRGNGMFVKSWKRVG